MSGHVVEWVTANPLWEGLIQDPQGLRRPALLRFVSDDFMDLLRALLLREPARLVDWVARPVSFGGTTFGTRDAARLLPDGAPLKLFQPVHGSFNLVAASLVCRQVGIPDRAVDGSRDERVGFVVRRIGAEASEQGWVDGTGWVDLPASAKTALVPGEDVLPLFPLSYAERDRQRRLWVGLIPATSRQAAVAPAQLAPANAEGDTRLDQFRQRVINPWQLLSQTSPNNLPDSIRERETEAARFVLLDFAEFLARELPAVWSDLSQGVRPPAAGSLFDQLNTPAGALGRTWLSLLTEAWDARDILRGDQPGEPRPSVLLAGTQSAIGPLQDAVSAALQSVPPAAATPGAGPPPALPALPRFEAGGTRYHVRCVYLRPECAGREESVVSDPSPAFELAPYFDADAPCRPIRITLPTDTSIAGLRKFSKNVAMVISSRLRGQLQSVGNATDTLQGKPGPGGGFDLGEICSFSLPIITLCAVVVLLIFIVLLNLVFWWLPFLRICLPLPKPKEA